MEKKAEGEMKRLRETGKVRGRQLMKRFPLHCPDMGENGSLPSGVKLLKRFRQCRVPSGIEAEESVRGPRCTRARMCFTAEITISRFYFRFQMY